MGLPELIFVSFVLGLTNSLRCLGFCMPVLIPFVGCEDRTIRGGFVTSIIFSVGRLVVYLIIGIIVVSLGSSLSYFPPKVMVIPLGFLTILYGLWVSCDWPNLSCGLLRTSRARPFLAIFLGVCMGGLLCPSLWLVILYAASSVIYWGMWSIVSFWVGSSVLVVATGAVSAALLGKVYERWHLRRILGSALVFIGVLHLLRLAA